MKMEQTECSETSAYKLQTPGNYPKEAYNNETLLGEFTKILTLPETKLGSRNSIASIEVVSRLWDGRSGVEIPAV